MIATILRTLAGVACAVLTIISAAGLMWAVALGQWEGVFVLVISTFFLAVATAQFAFNIYE